MSGTCAAPSWEIFCVAFRVPVVMMVRANYFGDIGLHVIKWL
jgi:hypothetical protein